MLTTIIIPPKRNKFLTNRGYTFSTSGAFHLQTGPYRESEEYSPHALPSYTTKQHFNIIHNRHSWLNQPNFMLASPQMTAVYTQLICSANGIPTVHIRYEYVYLFVNSLQYTHPSLLAEVKF